MNKIAKDEVNSLMNEYAGLETPEQKKEFKKKMDTILNGKTEAEREIFGKAMVAGAREAIRSSEELLKEYDFKKALDDIYKPVNWADFAESYFGKSRSWFSQRINGYHVNNKEAAFTPEEKRKLVNSLLDLSKRIENSARQLEHLL